MESAKNVAASAKAGMEKTKATMQEKAEKVATRDPLQKEIAAERKEEKIHQAERQKLEEKQAARAGGHPTAGVHVPHGQAGTGPGPGGEVATDPTVGGAARTRRRPVLID